MVDETTKELAEKVMDMTKAGVVEIWQKLQQAAPELWKLVVRQMQIDGIEYLIGAVLSLVAFCIGFWCLWRGFKKEGPDGEGLAIGGMFASLISLVLFFAFLINGLDLALNPAYWALKEIISMVRGH